MTSAPGGRAGPRPVGTFCLVLHSHLPWLAHHGRWPVGEEWLYQAWAQSYLPLLDLLDRLGARGERDLLTLGVTPVLAAQLDDPHCLRAMHEWLGGWLLRAELAAGLPGMGATAEREFRAATAALESFDRRWRHGGSPVLRRLVESGVLELLGGPLTHPFQPLLRPQVRDFALAEGLADTRHRLGHRPAGIWAPECGYAPGMEDGYAAADVGHFLVDGSALDGDTGFARPVGDSPVVCFARDVDVSFRVWSPRSGYPGDAAYRDFHTYDDPSGLKPARVTGKDVAPPDKAPYDPALAAEAVGRHVEDFVRVVRERLVDLADRHGRPGLVVAAFDTELFGHWWYEGPAWLAGVLERLPAAGVRVSTLRAARAECLGEPVTLPACSWGSGQDWRVWNGPQVADLVAENDALQGELLAALPPPGPARDPVADQAVREALLALSSDWTFMVSRASAADYARRRATEHLDRTRTLLKALHPPHPRDPITDLATHWRTQSPFGALDARTLPH